MRNATLRTLHSLHHGSLLSAHPLLSQLGKLDPQWLTTLGTQAMQGGVFCTAAVSPGLVGEVEPLLQAEAGGGPGLQRQVGAVVPSLPDSAVISGQSPLQVGHGHGFLEVNHGIGV